MNKEQKEQVAAILAEDCAIAGKYIDAKGQTCAIGALALAAGVPVSVLKTASATDIGDEYVPYTYPSWYNWPPKKARKPAKYGAVVKIRLALQEKFGLSIRDMEGIQAANDAVGNHETAAQATRRTKVISRLRKIRVERAKAARKLVAPTEAEVFASE